MAKRGLAILRSLHLVVTVPFLIGLTLMGLWMVQADNLAASSVRVWLPRVSGAAVPATPRTITVGQVVGEAEARVSSAATWMQVNAGQVLPLGGAIRTVGSSRVRLDISDGSVVALGFSTTMTVTQLSDAPNPVTLLDLGDGWLIFRTPGERGSGSFEVRTNNGSLFAGGTWHAGAALAAGGVDSAGIQHDAATGHSEIPVYEGLGTVMGRHTDVLQSAAGSRVLVGSFLYDTPQIGGPLTLEDIRQQNALWCLGATGMPDIAACDWTPTPTATATPTLTPTRTPTGPAPTGGPTMTASPTPFVRPTSIWPTPDPGEPLSAEELANQGTHHYTYTAVGFGDCHPDPSGDESIHMTFSSMAVTLSEPGGSETLVYTKISHNVYRLVSGAMTAYLEFQITGFKYWADKNGWACVDYVYRLAD